MKQFLKEMNHDFSGEIFLFSNNGNLVASTSNDFSQKDIAKLFNAQGDENTIKKKPMFSHVQRLPMTVLA